MEQKIRRMNDYFEKQITLCTQQSKALLADERIDESNFEKIKTNVYDIFRTVLDVAGKTGKGDPEAVQQFFFQKTEQIPKNWAASYENAKAHGDTSKMQLEQIKLDTIGEIRRTFLQIWEGAQ